jgi:hypothetical protein
LELLWKCRDIALLNKLRISNEGFKTGDHRTGEEREGKDQTEALQRLLWRDKCKLETKLL